jgi:L,D-transpeptidase catalytic domain
MKTTSIGLRDKLTRRSALKLATHLAITSSGLLVPNLIFKPSRTSAQQLPALPPPASLGRVTFPFLNVRTEPNTQAEAVARYLKDDVMDLRGQVQGEAVQPSNNVWFRTDLGYVYSSFVQPIENIKNKPETAEMARRGFWGEVTVPFTNACVAPGENDQVKQRLYYTGVFRIVDAAEDEHGLFWYRLKEGYAYTPSDWVLASDIRRIRPDELTPLSPYTDNKEIRIEIATQTLTAYENGAPVLVSKVASGYGDFETPLGDHTVIYKWPTARMTGGTGDDAYDLPGVAFPTFLNWDGVAIHAAYWHNDFGVKRSHGCLNVPAAVSRWVWRWTSPAAPYDEAYYNTPKGVTGTRVTVRERFSNPNNVQQI